MDSANGHIATNYDIPVITIWVTHPYAGFSPWNQTNESILSDKSLPTDTNICVREYLPKRL